VDFEDELIIALSELNKERRKNKSLKEDLIMLKEGIEEVRQVFMNLRAYLDESKVIEETLKD
jgi:hypothetical protein